MPAGYEAIRDKFISEGMGEAEAKTRAARIWNSTHKENPVTRAKDSIHPRFGEIIKRGCKEGTFLGRRGSVHYTILWKGEKYPEWVPAISIDRTGKIDNELLYSLIEKSAGEHEYLTKTAGKKTPGIFTQLAGAIKRGYTGSSEGVNTSIMKKPTSSLGGHEHLSKTAALPKRGIFGGKLEGKNTSSLSHIRRKGGLKKGPRKAVGQTEDVRGMHDPVQDEEPKQESVA